MTSGPSNSSSTGPFSLDGTTKAVLQGTYRPANDLRYETAAGAPAQPSHYASAPSAVSTVPGINQPYYSHSAWRNTWSDTSGYPYPATFQLPQQHSQNPVVQYQPRPLQAQSSETSANFSSRLKSPSPSLSPPPVESYSHWDEAIISFLNNLGLTQAAAGFEADMLIFNSTWEQREVPDALAELINNLSLLGMPKNEDHKVERSLDERKLDYVHGAKGIRLQTPTTINKSISAFLANNKARNDASNRAEFVNSLASKRRRITDDVEAQMAADPPSCARTDAKPLDRDEQMKYDIAKNEEGPLSRTIVHPPVQSSGKQKAKTSEATASSIAVGTTQGSAELLTADQNLGLDERLKNIESHLSVRYVPSPPRAILDRLKYLEEHIIRLEKEYPPWAALHFNQPNRGWPPPPRATPIIVPPNQRASNQDVSKSNKVTPSGPDGSAKVAKNATSSLHRAVLERLEVQQAMSDLAGGSGR